MSRLLSEIPFRLWVTTLSGVSFIHSLCLILRQKITFSALSAMVIIDKWGHSSPWNRPVHQGWTAPLGSPLVSGCFRIALLCILFACQPIVQVRPPKVGEMCCLFIEARHAVEETTIAYKKCCLNSTVYLCFSDNIETWPLWLVLLPWELSDPDW